MSVLPREIWEDFIGASYQQAGRGPTHYDCYGLCMEIFRRRGIIIPDARCEFSMKALIEAFKAGTHCWKADLMTPGCLLAFGKGRLTIHCGIAIDGNRFIHASEKMGSVLIGRLRDSHIAYHSDFIGSYSYVG